MKDKHSNEHGDGLAFHNAVKLSKLKALDIQNSMGISNGTFYSYFKLSELDEDVKQAAAKALGKSVEEIFGAKGDGLDKVKKRIPVLGDAAAGGDMVMNVADENYTAEYIDVGDLLSDSEAAFTVYGNSMTPAYPSGCVLGLIRNYDNFIQPGETYVLLTKSNRVFKRLYYNDDKTGYICISDNTMKHEAGPMTGKYFYPPFEVKGEDVISVFDVTGMIRRNRNSAIMQRQK